MNKFESRYFNTAVIMDEALIDLLDKKEYPYISIKEVCDKAGVNRSTFYLHYEKMDDLLEETIKYVNEKFVSYFSSTDLNKNSLHELSLDQMMFITPKYLSPLLNFMKDYKKVLNLYKKLPHVFNTMDTFETIKNDILYHVLSEFSVPKGIQKYYIEYYINGLFAIIYSWIDDECAQTVDEMIEIITSIIRGNKYNGENYDKN